MSFFHEKKISTEERNREWFSQKLKESFMIDCEYIHLSSSLTPTKDNINDLPIANAAYVRSGDNLFYINKANQELIKINITSDELNQITSFFHLSSLDKPVLMSEKELRKFCRIQDEKFTAYAFPSSLCSNPDFSTLLAKYKVDIKKIKDSKDQKESKSIQTERSLQLYYDNPYDPESGSGPLMLRPQNAMNPNELMSHDEALAIVIRQVIENYNNQHNCGWNAAIIEEIYRFIRPTSFIDVWSIRGSLFIGINKDSHMHELISDVIKLIIFYQGDPAKAVTQADDLMKHFSSQDYLKETMRAIPRFSVNQKVFLEVWKFLESAIKFRFALRMELQPQKGAVYLRENKNTIEYKLLDLSGNVAHGTFLKSDVGLDEKTIQSLIESKSDIGSRFLIDTINQAKDINYKGRIQAVLEEKLGLSDDSHPIHTFYDYSVIQPKPRTIYFEKKGDKLEYVFFEAKEYPPDHPTSFSEAEIEIYPITGAISEKDLGFEFKEHVSVDKLKQLSDRIIKLLVMENKINIIRPIEEWLFSLKEEFESQINELKSLSQYWNQTSDFYPDIFRDAISKTIKQWLEDRGQILDDPLDHSDMRTFHKLMSELLFYTSFVSLDVNRPILNEKKEEKMGDAKDNKDVKEMKIRDAKDKKDTGEVKEIKGENCLVPLIFLKTNSLLTGIVKETVSTLFLGAHLYGDQQSKANEFIDFLFSKNFLDEILKNCPTNAWEYKKDRPSMR